MNESHIITSNYERNQRLRDDEELRLYLICSSDGDSSLNFRFKLDNNARLYLKVLILAKGDSKIRLNYLVQHCGDNTMSDCQILSLLDGRSAKESSMIIEVDNDATDVVAKEREDCLLLSNDAKSRAVPRVICYNEKVDIEHSFACGHFGDSQIEYLTARGLSKRRAKRLLLDSKIRSFIDGIEDENHLEYIQRCFKQ